MIGKVRDWLKPWMKGSSPLEIRRAILDDVESHVVAVGEGRRIFPHNLLRVHLRVAGPLAETGCPLPPGFELHVDLDEEDHPRFAERRFYVEYLNAEAPAAAVT